MSANFHAYQNRGFLFTGYEAICGKWRDTFSNFDPQRAAKALNLSYDEKHLYLTYFATDYRLRLADGVLEKSVPRKELPEEKRAEIGRVFREKRYSEGWSPELFFNESMAIYHLLTYIKDEPRKEGAYAPADRITRSGNAPDPLSDSFSKEFSGKCEELKKAAESMGAVFVGKGDVAFEVRPFPGVPLRLEFWDADEDFPAQVQIFVNENITDFIHYETIGCLISDLFEKLSQAAFR